jgi:hypothetical protein
VRRIGLQRGEVERHQVAFLEAGLRPVLLEGDGDLPRHVALDGGPRRQRRLHHALLGDEQMLGVEEVEGALEEHRRGAAVGIAQHQRPHGHVLHRPAIELLGGRERLAALHELDHVGIAGLSDLALGPFGGDGQGVAVDPGVGRLGLRQVEAAVDEAAGLGVELARHRGVLAAVREPDQAQPLVGLEAGRAAEHPGDALGLGERVDVEQGAPLGLGRAVARERRGPPDPLDVVGVLPEIAQAAVAGDVHGRDAVAGGDDLQRLGVDGGVARIAL